MRATLQVALYAPDLPTLLRAAGGSAMIPAVPPSAVRLDGRSVEARADWAEKWASDARGLLAADWGRGGTSLVYNPPGSTVVLFRPDTEIAVESVLAWLATLPFELATTGPVYREWEKAYRGLEVTSFGRGLVGHGWMCAFKGDGHRRLCSRRWLDQDLWTLHRGSDDTSLVQFHALDAAWDAALAQAKPAHVRMGASKTGGFLPFDYRHAMGLEGEYVPASRELRIIVSHRDVSQIEMRDRCAVRLMQALGPEQPIDRVAYWFTEEERAHAHVRELWLRELECWAIVDGRPTRLDGEAAPVVP